MNDLAKIAIQQLEERAKGLKWELERVIDEKVESVKGQLERLSELKVPLDLLDLYLKNNGKVWVSKVVGIGGGSNFRFDFWVGTRNLFYPTPQSREPEFRLPTGLYRLVLMAIPQDIKVGEKDVYVDDYGVPFVPEGDC